MEDNEVTSVSVYVDNVHIAQEQYETLVAELQQQNENLVKVNDSVGHATTFLILLVVFQFYGLLSRARKKGGA